MTSDVRLLGWPIQTRRQRRAVVAAMYASYPGFLGLGAVASAGHARWLVGPFVFVMLGVLIATYWVVHQVALPYGPDANCGARAGRLDERQVQVRDRAFYRAYQVVTTVFALWFAYDAGARSFVPGLWTPSNWNQYQAVLWGLLILAATFPSAYIAWTEPDLPSSEPTDHAGRTVPGSDAA